MKYHNFILIALIACLFSCSSDDTFAPAQPKMLVRFASIAEGETVDARDITSITVSTNNLVTILQPSAITLNGTPVSSTTAKGMDILIDLALSGDTEYVLKIGNGALAISDKQEYVNSDYTLNFKTLKGPDPIDVSKISDKPVNQNATVEAVALYTKLRSNYGKTMYTGAMGAVGWGTEYTDFLYEQTGAYPVVVGFDYLHLPYSPSNWIDYGDITPVKKVHDKGCIVEVNWHWNVPTVNPGSSGNTAETTVLWEGSQVMPANWSGSVQLADAAAIELFKQASVGDIIEVEVKDVNAGAQGSFKTMDSGWNAIAPNTEYFDITGNFQLTIDQSILDKLLTTGLIVSGHDYTATKITLNSTISKVKSRADMSFNANNSEFNPANVVIDGTWENQVAVKDVEKLAGYLKLLQEAKIPVLWRPFHEAAGDYTWGSWFWWGSQGAKATKDLYLWLYNKLTYEYGLNNLIWVWTVQTSSAGQPADLATIKEWYPGDEYVDIVGTDLYPSEQLTDQSEQFYLVNNSVDGKKIVALTECGNLVSPEAAYRNNALWSYFMQWYDLKDDVFGFHNYGGPDQWRTVLDSPYVTGIK